MFQFVGKFDALKIDEKGFTRYLGNRLNKLYREAAKEFLQAVLSKGVPVLTGTAASTLIPLGRYVGTVVPIVPRMSISEARRKWPEEYAGKSPGQSMDNSKVIRPKFSPNNPKSRLVIQFTVHRDISRDHYYINDNYSNPLFPGTPWKTVEAGRAAFRRYIRANLKTGRKISSFVTRTRVATIRGTRR